MYATGQFPALVRTGLPLEGLQFALIMYALLSVIFIGLSLRMNVALTCLFTSIGLAYFCLAVGLTHDERRVTKVLPLLSCAVTFPQGRQGAVIHFCCCRPCNHYALYVLSCIPAALVMIIQ